MPSWSTPTAAPATPRKRAVRCTSRSGSVSGSPLTRSRSRCRSTNCSTRRASKGATGSGRAAAASSFSCCLTGGGGCRPPSRRASIRTVNRTGGRMSVDIRRETEELVRYYGELVRRLGQSGVRDVADLLALYERLGRALETVSRQEIGWVTEQVQRLIEALVRMDSNLDALRRLKKALSPPPEGGDLEPAPRFR